MRTIIGVLCNLGKILRETLTQPFDPGRSRKAQQCQMSALSTHFANTPHHHVRRFLHDTFAHQSSTSAAGEQAIERSLVFAHAELIHKSSENAALQCFRCGGLFGRAQMLLCDVVNLMPRHCHLLRTHRVDAVPSTSIDLKSILLRMLECFDEHEEIALVTDLELLSRLRDVLIFPSQSHQ